MTERDEPGKTPEPQNITYLGDEAHRLLMQLKEAALANPNFQQEALDQIRNMRHAASELTAALGLPPELKYEMMSVMFGRGVQNPEGKLLQFKQPDKQEGI